MNGTTNWSVASARVPMSFGLRKPALQMSDVCFLFGLGLALFFVTDPFGWRLERILLAKHLPLFFTLSGAILVMFGAALFQPLAVARTQPFAIRPYAGMKVRWPVLRAAWPLAVLGLWIVTGSLVARNFVGIHNTFLGMGLHMLLTLVVARVVLVSGASLRIVSTYLILASLAAIGMVAGRALNISASVGAYHEMEGLMIPLAVYYALRPMGSERWRFIPVVFFLVAGITMQKYTAYLVVAITLVYLWLADWRLRFRASSVFRRRAVMMIFMVLVATLLAGAWLSARQASVLPTGNPQYRLTTYETTWKLFRDSPLWGTLFMGSATEKFSGFDIAAARGVLPSHSDVLDLAAHGGMLALGLWLWGHVRIGRRVWRTLIRPVEKAGVTRSASGKHATQSGLLGHDRDEPGGHTELSAVSHALTCMVLTTVLVYAFNPIMLQPVKALLLWSQLGMLLGLALHSEQNAHAGRSAAQVRRG